MFRVERPTQACPRATRGPSIISVALLFLVLSTAACRTTRAPAGFVPRADVAAQTAVGAWVEVEGHAHDSTIIAMGELIAVTEDSIALFDADTLRIIAMSSVGRVRLARYYVPNGEIGVWTLFGTISTVTHGYFLIVSAPAWIGTGLATAVVAQRRAIDVTRDVTRIRPYARFPQGIPATVDRTLLVRAKRPT